MSGVGIEPPTVGGGGGGTGGRGRRGLRGAALRGFFWLVVQTVGSRAVTFASQIALAWLLVPEAFGLMALAQTAMSVVLLVQHIGIRDVLIQRSHKVGLWSGHAYWFSFAVGLAASLVMAVLAPVAAAVYGEPELTGVVLVLAAAPLPRALANVSQAVLRTRMRFRSVAMLEFGATAGIAAMAVTLAWLGFGAYALALPVPIAAGMVLLVGNRLAGVGSPGRLRPGRWGYLVSSGAVLLLSRVCLLIAQQGDYMVLGLFRGAEMVGLYFFAFNLSLQTVRLLTENLVGVLLPALSEMKGDVERATAAFVRAARLLGAVGVPVALLQLVFAGPIVTTLFEEKWHGAAGLVRLLSVAMMFQLLGVSTASMLKSQRRYRVVLGLAAMQALVLLALATPAAWLGGEEDAAWWVALAVVGYSAITSPVRVMVAVRPGGIGAAAALELFGRPLLAGVAGASVGWLACELAGLDPVRSWGGASLASAVGLPVYAAAARSLMPDAFGEIVSIARRGGRGRGG